MDSRVNNAKISVMLIEDNAGDARLIQEMLKEFEKDHFELTILNTLSQGVACLAENRFEFILLDLSLPDSQGLNTFLSVHSHAPDIPIVVLTGAEDEISAMQIMRAGAQDYLLKGEIDSRLLVRSIRYSMERQGLLSALENERQRQRGNDEVQFLSRLATPSQTEMTAKLFGMGPLREILPGVFDEMVQRYSLLMNQALEKRAYKVDFDISDGLRDMGENLGMLKALPRDVVEIHTSALSVKHKQSSPQRFKAYAEEGRFMLIEMMGYLTTYYRRYAVGR